MLIKIYDKIGEHACTYKQADLLYIELIHNFKTEDVITLDFQNVSVVSSPFFNGSIGLMLKDTEITELQKRIKFVNIDEHTKSILNLVVANAIKFYKKD